MYGDMQLGPSSPIAAQPQRPLFQPQQPKRGGFLSGLSDFFLGSPGRTEQFQNYTPQQQMALNQLLSQGMSGLDTGVLEQQARQGFAQNTVPSIAERFTSMGSGGGQRSSAFAGSLGSAGVGLESSLAGLRQGRLMQMLQMGLTPQFETMYNPASQGIFGSILPGLSQGAGAAGGLAAMKKFGMLGAI
ncbi:hypothetical protein M0R72_16305 [Candidatus Pacearchaeota archaeon]|jgi:hypothetical protein|nr:hypothetical protein [Candidatus Pacearchaeota archaeon]